MKNKKQLVRDQLYDYKFNGRRIYREALDIIEENTDVFQSYVNLLEPVQDAVVILQAQNYPTINKALVLYQSIRENFEEHTQSADILTRHMAESGLQVLNYHQTIPSTNSETHLLGLLLDPLKKDELERCCHDIIITDAIATFRRKVKAVQRQDTVQPDPYDLSPPSPFSVHIADANGNPPQDLVDVEINKYLSLPSQSLQILYQNVTEFWSKEEKNYPTVAKLARRILCVTSSAASEGLFNLLGRNVTSTRGSLNPATVSSLITMKNLIKFKEYEPQDTVTEDETENLESDAEEGFEELEEEED
uniref:HAT C-terminal dimerisation domain-containing protein n=1 Tax=Panagrolaimus sp. PS1159 TaxID=55785 RepID=A0AC35G276_9BILA